MVSRRGIAHVGLQLLDAGAKPDLLGHFRETALHWAALLGLSRLVGAMIEKGASVNLTDEKYKATPLRWALHGWGNPPPPGGDGGRHHQVVARLVAAGAQVDPAMLTSPKVLADSDMLSALQGGHACHD